MVMIITKNNVNKMDIMENRNQTKTIPFSKTSTLAKMTTIMLIKEIKIIIKIINMTLHLTITNTTIYPKTVKESINSTMKMTISLMKLGMITITNKMSNMFRRINTRKKRANNSILHVPIILNTDTIQISSLIK